MRSTDLLLLALTATVACARPPSSPEIAPTAPPSPAPRESPARAVSRHTIAVSDFHDCAVAKDKRVYCWNSQVPPFVLDALPAGEGGALRVALSSDPSRVCLVSEAGHVFCNKSLEPGDTRLVRVEGVERAVDISMAHAHACVTTEEGRVVCWEDNTPGHLESGGQKPPTNPVDTGMTDAVEVSVWPTMTCALAKTGRVWCWGAVVPGEPHVLQPKVLEPYTDVRQLGTGAEPCLVHADGHATCWSANIPSNAPELQAKAKHVVVPGLSDAVAITQSNSDFSCAIRKNGTVSCGGSNELGFLGRGDWKDAEHGKPVLGLTDVVEVATWNAEVCARRASGSVHCWGKLHHRDPKAPYFVPTPTIVSGASPSEEVVCEEWHCCSRTRGGGLECWGDARFMADAELRVPVEVPPARSGATLQALAPFIGEPEKMPVDGVVALGRKFVVTGSGKLHRIEPREGPDGKRWSLKEPVEGIPPVSRLLADDPVCFEEKGGKTRCAGGAYWRSPPGCDKTGTGGVPWPPWDPQLGLGASATMSASPYSGCAIDGGVVRCWGESQQRRYGVDLPANAPCNRPFVFTIPAAGAKPPYTRIALGASLCVVDADGSLLCAGYNVRGQLGRGTKTDGERRLERVPNLEPVVDVAIAGHTTCAVGRSGKVFCWGANEYGQLGDGTAGARKISKDPKWAESADRATPGEALGITNAKAITASFASFCALLADGKIACWGKNEHGEVGIGGRGRMYSPRPLEVVELTELRPVNVTP